MSCVKLPPLPFLLTRAELNSFSRSLPIHLHHPLRLVRRPSVRQDGCVLLPSFLRPSFLSSPFFLVSRSHPSSPLSSLSHLFPPSIPTRSFSTPRALGNLRFAPVSSRQVPLHPRSPPTSSATSLASRNRSPPGTVTRARRRTYSSCTSWASEGSGSQCGWGGESDDDEAERRNEQGGRRKGDWLGFLSFRGHFGLFEGGEGERVKERERQTYSAQATKKKKQSR